MSKSNNAPDDRARGARVEGVSPKRRRGRRSAHIQERRSSRSGVTYFYGDFRQYDEVGGKVEPLRVAGERTATSDADVARRLYLERAATYEALRHDRRAGVAVTSSPEKPRLKPMMALHLERKGAKRGRRRSSTIRRDRYGLDRILVHFGNCLLTDITPQGLDEYVLRREGEPGVRRGSLTSPNTIRNELHALSSMFRRAIAMGFVRENPVRQMAEKPQSASAEAEYLTAEDGGKLLDAAAALDDETRRAARAAALRRKAHALGDARRVKQARALRALARAEEGGRPSPAHVARSYPFLEVVIAVLLYTGGRISEVLGLLVSDVDFNRKRVYFRPNDYRLLKRLRHQREVELWPPLEALLRWYLAATGLTGGLLFPSRTGNMIRSFNKQFARCVERAGIARGRVLSPHSLRHTFATQLLQTLVPSVDGPPAVRSSYEVAKRLGHRSSALVDAIYGHLVTTPTYRYTLSYEDHRTRSLASKSSAQLQT